MLNTNTYYLYFCNTANLQGICTESGDCAHIAGAYCDTTAKQCKCGAAYLAGTAGETNCVGISKYDVYYKNTLFPIGHSEGIWLSGKTLDCRPRDCEFDPP